MRNTRQSLDKLTGVKSYFSQHIQNTYTQKGEVVSEGGREGEREEGLR